MGFDLVLLTLYESAYINCGVYLLVSLEKLIIKFRLGDSQTMKSGFSKNNKLTF